MKQQETNDKIKHKIKQTKSMSKTWTDICLMDVGMSVPCMSRSTWTDHLGVLF